VRVGGFFTLLFGISAQASTYCAHDSVALASDLTDVSTGGGANGHDNIIHLVAGTFTTSGAPFNFTTASGFALTIDGGYDATCTNQDLTPGSTILDGGNLTRVLTIQTNGAISVRHVTIQHALYDGSAGAAGQIYLGLGTSGVATFDDNVVRDNVSGYSVGGFVFFGNGTVHIDNNLFVGNSAPTSAAFATSMGDNSTIYITNNTISANTNSTVNSMIVDIGGGGATTLAYVSNTLSHGNNGPGAYDYYLNGFENVQFTNNDYGSITGAKAPASSGNLINIDPQFVGGGDYHLMPTSPLLRAGIVTPPGGLPATDLEGNPRSVAGKVDLGAYEDIDVIFANDFETP